MSGSFAALKVMRPPFLILTPTSVLLGVAASAGHAAPDTGWLFCLILLGALCAHVAVNSLNEYHDFVTGLDLHTVRTPFSGGSGALPAQPQLAWMALSVAAASLLLTAAIGIYFISVRGVYLLPLGLLGLLLVVAYTPVLCRHALLCLVAPGLGFGPLMVIGTSYVLSGEYSALAVSLSLVPFFLVNNLLLLNQFPDVSADRVAGRRTLPMILGRRKSLGVYALFLVLACCVIVADVALGILPAGCLGTLLVIPLGVAALMTAYRHYDDLDRLIPAMYLNLGVVLSVPLVLALTLVLA